MCGADQEVLISVYKNSMRSKLDIGNQVYVCVRKSKMQFLDRIKLTVWKLATGAFRTSHRDAFPADTSVMPLNFHRYTENIIYLSNISATPQYMNYDLITKYDEFSRKPSTTNLPIPD